MLITRQLKGLEEFFPVTVVDWFLGDNGWTFPADDKSVPGAQPDPLYHSKRVMDLYLKANPDYEARATVPIVWDKKKETIVSNESAEIIRFLNTAFNDQIAPEFSKIDIYPETLQKDIDELNEWVYNDINNGVYKSGFATTQEAYDSNVYKLFDSLDRVEKILEESEGEFLFGKNLTEADIRLYTTIVRFDVVYQQHFKCNIRDIRSGYPAIHKWLRNLYWKNPAFKDTTNFEHIKKHYTKSHVKYNPFGITPAGPLPNILPL